MRMQRRRSMEAAVGGALEASCHDHQIFDRHDGAGAAASAMSVNQALEVAGGVPALACSHNVVHYGRQQPDASAPARQTVRVV